MGGSSTDWADDLAGGVNACIYGDADSGGAGWDAGVAVGCGKGVIAGGRFSSLSVSTGAEIIRLISTSSMNLFLRLALC